MSSEQRQAEAIASPPKVRIRHIPHSVFSIPNWIILLALFTFIPVLTGYFLADDFVLLGWTHGGSPTQVPAFFDPNTFWFYRPVVKVYYWAGQSLFGLDAEPFHIVSLLIHGANAYLVYRLVAGHDNRRWRHGFLAALIFLWVPYHAETVAWIAATGDLAATFCVLAVLLLMRRYRQGRHIGYLLVSLFLFTIALFTRETAVLLVGLLLLDLVILDGWDKTKDEGQRTKGRIIWSMAAFLVPLAVYVAIQASGSQAAAGRGGLSFRSLNIESILLGVMQYVHGLVPGGNFLAQLPLDAQRVAVWVETVIIVILAIFFWKARWRIALFGLAWLLATPLIFIFFSAPTDRYFYLPSIGYAILVSSVLLSAADWIGSREPGFPLTTRVASAGLAVILLVSEVVGLLNREAGWRAAGQISRAVFSDTRRATPDPHDYAAFFFIDLPTTINNVPAFGNGLQQAIQLLYDNDSITASSVDCTYLQSQPELPRYSYFLRYNGNGVDALAHKEDCR